MEVTIVGLGGLGEGIAETPWGRRFVPGALPGDRVRVRPSGEDRATVTAMIAPGPAHAVAPCRHFGTCGGCALQHVAPPLYAEWKRGLVTLALERRGLDPAVVGPLVSTSPASRRRTRLASLRRTSDVVLGYNARASRQIVDVTECPVLVSALASLLPALRATLHQMLQPGERLDVALLAVPDAIDLLVVAPRPPRREEREGLAALPVARIAWRRGETGTAEPILVRAPVRARFGGIAVDLPPGAFLQPSAEGEAALVEFVRAAAADVPSRKRPGTALDLYAGCGTFALSLLGEGWRVRAYEGDAESVAALSRAAAGRLTATGRDLARRPLATAELADADLVVLDPPRAGAEAQVRLLAASAVPRVAYVSCNPVTFARDAAILAAGGYALRTVMPVDQFLWSPHVELAAVLTRAT